MDFFLSASLFHNYVSENSYFFIRLGAFCIKISGKLAFFFQKLSQIFLLPLLFLKFLFQRAMVRSKCECCRSNWKEVRCLWGPNIEVPEYRRNLGIAKRHFFPLVRISSLSWNLFSPQVLCSEVTQYERSTMQPYCMNYCPIYLIDYAPFLNWETAKQPNNRISILRYLCICVAHIRVKWELQCTLCICNVW